MSFDENSLIILNIFVLEVSHGVNIGNYSRSTPKFCVLKGDKVWIFYLLNSTFGLICFDLVFFFFGLTRPEKDEGLLYKNLG